MVSRNANDCRVLDSLRQQIVFAPFGTLPVCMSLIGVDQTLQLKQIEGFQIKSQPVVFPGGPRLSRSLILLFVLKYESSTLVAVLPKAGIDGAIIADSALAIENPAIV